MTSCILKHPLSDKKKCTMLSRGFNFYLFFFNCNWNSLLSNTRSNWKLENNFSLLSIAPSFTTQFQGSLIQVPMSEKGKITRGRLGSLSLKKEGERQCFLFSKHLIICTRGSGGKLHLTKVRSRFVWIMDYFLWWFSQILLKNLSEKSFLRRIYSPISYWWICSPQKDVCQNNEVLIFLFWDIV